MLEEDSPDAAYVTRDTEYIEKWTDRKRQCVVSYFGKANPSRITRAALSTAIYSYTSRPGRL